MTTKTQESTSTSLSAHIRLASASSTQLRAQGFIPGILYGKNEDHVMLSLQGKELDLALRNIRRYDVLNLNLQDETSQNKAYNVIVQDLQYHPTKRGTLLHIDFRHATSQLVRVKVPVRYINHDKCIALKRGFVLNVVLKSLEVFAPGLSIPSFIEADLSHLEVGGSLTLDHIALTKDVRPVQPKRDRTLATLVATSQE